MVKEWKSEAFSPHTDSLATGNFYYLMDDDNLYITWYGGPQPSMAGITGNIVLINFSGHPEIAKRLLDPDPQNKGRIVLTGITRNQTNDIVLIYERAKNIITIGGGTPFTTNMRFGVDLVIPIKKSEPVRVKQIEEMPYFSQRGGLVANSMTNDKKFTDRINALVWLKTNWFPSGNTLTAMSNTFFCAYAMQDIFPFFYENINSLLIKDWYDTFHNDELIEEGIDQLLWEGTPEEFKQAYSNMLEDLKAPQSHQLYTGFDKQLVFIGDDNFTDENTALGFIWNNQIIAVTVDDGLHEYAIDDFFNLFDVAPTKVAVIRII